MKKRKMFDLANQNIGNIVTANSRQVKIKLVMNTGPDLHSAITQVTLRSTPSAGRAAPGAWWRDF